MKNFTNVSLKETFEKIEYLKEFNPSFADLIENAISEVKQPSLRTINHYLYDIEK